MQGVAALLIERRMSPEPTEQPLALSSFSLRSWPSGRDDLQQALLCAARPLSGLRLGLQLGSDLYATRLAVACGH